MAKAKKRQRRGSKLSTGNSKRGMEFSKKIVILTGILFTISLLEIQVMVIGGLDVSNFATQTLLTTGGIFGASIVFYLNKAKLENLAKGKLRFVLLRLRLELKLKNLIPEESYQQVMDEINELDDMVDNKLDDSLEEAIQKEIDTQNF